MVPSFKDRLQAVNPEYETFENLQTLQVNLGNLCNLHCTHCHVDASNRGTEIMGTVVMDQIAGFLIRHPCLTLDITGGCPEMNPNFRYLINKTEGVATRRMLRSNLALMAEPGWDWLPEFCRNRELTVVGSLPCYSEENVDQQRGSGVYQKSIQVLKRLNSLGYGTEMELDLVYNPGGDFVPGSQQGLEAAYKAELSVSHGIVFNHLFTITNAPIGRFRKHLEATGTYSDYLRMLAGRFNPEAAGNIMCRTLISVDWQGKIYNCDFNQALGMPVTADDGSDITISALDDAGMNGKLIDLAQHCYCCTAGEGSSCTGALAQ
ncbi:MAG: arsenosugar biosynthesis radical SAM protein ArsS [Desulfuromonadaceae bacterium]|nr:arsenosugar biosynthesis radical SAM protein ArsS [Desulfuromonadaceae bacterium]MDD5107218.1 arsenosugar biosynthesis radical SAM protein ArsS [Desulfuromonadaceae bacterium]